MTPPPTTPDDPLDRAFCRFFAREMAGLDRPVTPTVTPRKSRRSELTLALSVGLGLAAALTLLPTPDGRNRPRTRATAPTTSLLEGATADGSRLPAAK